MTKVSAFCIAAKSASNPSIARGCSIICRYSSTGSQSDPLVAMPVTLGRSLLTSRHENPVPPSGLRKS
jgi:hypothetical protein